MSQGFFCQAVETSEAREASLPETSRTAAAARELSEPRRQARCGTALRYLFVSSCLSISPKKEKGDNWLMQLNKIHQKGIICIYIYNTSNQEMVERASPGEAKRSWIQGLSKGERRRHAADFARCLHVLLNWRTQDMLQKEATRFVVLTRAKCSYRLVCEVFFLQKFSIIF